MQGQYKKELEIMESAVRKAYAEVFSADRSSSKDKGKFDVVTENDFRIEKYLIKTIEDNFSGDLILSEEYNSETAVKGRTWTVDPIDGTYNMTRNAPLFGIQCALYENDEIVFAIGYLPVFDEMYHAQKGCGAYLNGKKITVNKFDVEHSVVSFGDISHRRTDDAADQLKIMNGLSQYVAKYRMFGTACFDFVYLASGRIDGTVIFTKNKWDIAPGMLIAKEAGALVRSLDGDYNNDSRAVIATATPELYELIAECYKK